MKIGLRGGHSPNCKGAIGIVDEQVEVRKIYRELKPLLEAQGHTVIDCNSDESSSGADLRKGTNTANNNKCDMFISIHMNAFNGNAHGTEVWLYDHKLDDKAKTICKNLVALGLTNRGVKYSQGLHDLRATAMPAMIIETLFCDNANDCNVYKNNGANGLAKEIAKAFGVIVDKPSKPAPEPVKPTPAKKTNTDIAKEVLAGKWGNGDSRKVNLEKAGYNYNAIQAEVNRLCGATPAPAKKPEPMFKINTMYTLQAEMRVRTGPGINYRAKRYNELTPDGQKHDRDKDGCLDKGTRITVLETRNVGNDVWVRCPSGWIAGYNNGKKYLK